MSAPSPVALRKDLAGTWHLDPTSSTAGFTVRAMGLLRVRGTVPLVTGEVEVDEAGVVVRLLGLADPAGVATGNARRDRDLRGPGLLAVAEHPSWTFTAQRATGNGGTWQVPGTLNVRTACPLTWTAQVRGLQDGMLRATATARLDRLDAGVRAPRVLVGRQVDLRLDLVLVR